MNQDKVLWYSFDMPAKNTYSSGSRKLSGKFFPALVGNPFRRPAMQFYLYAKECTGINIVSQVYTNYTS